METKELTISRVHHGRNIRRTRLEKNIKQERLCDLVGMAQSSVSRYESTRVIGDDILQKFAKALDVPFEYLKTLEEDAPLIILENNTVNNNDHATGNTMGFAEQNFNPLEKVTELYERLLKEKDEKYAALERRLENLERNAGK